MFLTDFDIEFFFDPKPYPITDISLGQDVAVDLFKYFFCFVVDPSLHNSRVISTEGSDFCEINISIAFESIMSATPVLPNLAELFVHFCHASAVPVVVDGTVGSFGAGIAGPFIMVKHYPE